MLLWRISGVATRDDSVRVTVAFPADTLSRTVSAVGTSLPLAAVAQVWPHTEMPRGAYVWRVEARSLSGSRLRSGPEPLILDRPVRAFGRGRNENAQDPARTDLEGTLGVTSAPAASRD